MKFQIDVVLVLNHVACVWLSGVREAAKTYLGMTKAGPKHIFFKLKSLLYDFSIFNPNNCRQSVYL
jgi:hypothetical protein